VLETGARLLCVVAVALLGAACGAADEAAPGTSGTTSATSAAPAATAPPVAAPPAPRAGASLNDVLGLRDADTFTTPDVISLGALDLPAGKAVRIPFAVFDKGGTQRRVDGGRAQVWLGRTPTDRAVGPFPAREEIVAADGVPREEGDVDQILVAHPAIPRPGGWYMVATYTVDGKPSSAHTGLSLLAKERSPAVGEPAPRSETPTLRSTGGDLAALSTAERPERALLEHSVAESIDDRVPFVVVFATPRFCQSRLCGPVVEIVAQVQRELRASGMRFIHVEVYDGNDPENGTNAWFREWRLETEPWVFVVGGDGRVRSKFEGSVSPRELEAAARAALPA